MRGFVHVRRLEGATGTVVGDTAALAGNISWRKVVQLQLHSTNFRVFHFVLFPVIDPLYTVSRPLASSSFLPSFLLLSFLEAISPDQPVIHRNAPRYRGSTPESRKGDHRPSPYISWSSHPPRLFPSTRRALVRKYEEERKDEYDRNPPDSSCDLSFVSGKGSNPSLEWTDSSSLFQ